MRTAMLDNWLKSKWKNNLYFWIVPSTQWPTPDNCSGSILFHTWLQHIATSLYIVSRSCRVLISLWQSLTPRLWKGTNLTLASPPSGFKRGKSRQWKCQWQWQWQWQWLWCWLKQRQHKQIKDNMFQKTNNIWQYEAAIALHHGENTFLLHFATFSPVS